ncbi:MAG: amidohydrolase [Solobacterium sp.]|nr:amidohydrolase [Solobacterium sp.]
MFTNEFIQQAAAEVHDYVIEMRREMHKRAEVAPNCVRAGAFIREQLDAMGIPWEPVENHGCFATLDSGRPGPHIGLRADFDALPMPEDECNLSQKRIVMSDTPDKTCHGCGHDAHTAMLLGAAKILSANMDKFDGIIYLAFEDGEENGTGWPGMEKVLKTKQIDTFWGIHVWADLPSGTICVQEGPRMAGGIGVDITFVGKGGHGSRPDQSANPVFMAANYLNNLAVAWANQIDANETVTLGITSIQGGEVSNVIPDTAHVIGSCRLFNVEEGKKAFNILKTVAENTAAMHNGHVEFGPRFMMFGGPVVNDPYYAALAEAALPEVLGAGAVVKSQPWYASESFGRYLSMSPGVFAHLGINNPAKGTGAAHHNSKFDVDEDVLDMGVKATMKYVAAVLEKGIKH